MEAKLPQLPITKYTKRDQRNGLSRRLGFSSLDQVAKNKHKIVNEQRIAMKNLKEQTYENKRPSRPKDQRGKHLVGRKLKIDKSWKKDVNKQKKKKKEPANKIPEKSLDDLDKEMEDYFKSEKE
ncbi:uncharacterized protein HGUI_00954 [Hanseniaspora guilliermondii]|uniref:Chromatin target of PRMT1 protein C-terminal domain-containing protein n=1 Tax=Hanseniaspora guilliermondii TaxID=56406 RepID=A0A1L0AWV3_9ASCO|nr:uncharacterized protein HGUI_00954 [Hanseniaspora guilliermondii]